MNKKGTRALASATVVGLVLSTAISTGNVQAAPGKVDRLGGGNRYQTAANVATKNWSKADNVILVSGEGYADALSASLLAQKLDAPVLLTGKDGLNEDTSKAINSLGAKNVYILGSEGVVSQNVQSSLEKSGKKVTRLAGHNRYQTNVAIANELVKNHGVKADDVLVVNGNKYLADALTAAPVAAKEGKILLLVGETEESAKEAKEFIKNNGVKNVTVIGRDVTVSDSVYKELGANKRVNGGKDRFETNRLVLQAFGLKGSHLYVANGQDDHLVDSLVASAIAGKFNSPVVLVANDKNADAKAIEYIKANANEKTDLNVVGSEAILSNDMVEDINNAVKVERLKVASVSAITKTEVTIVLAEKPAEELTADKFAVKANGTDVKVEKLAKVDSDLTGKTYKLTVGSLDNKEGKLAVNGTEKAFDFKAPEVKGIEVKDATHIVVNFNEELNEDSLTNANFKIKKVAENVVAAPASKVVLNADKKSVTVTLGTALVPADYVLSLGVAGGTTVQDVAKNGIYAGTEVSFRPTAAQLENKVAPALTKATYNKGTGILSLTFDKDILDSKLDVTKLSINSVALTAADTVDTKTTADDNIVEIKLGEVSKKAVNALEGDLKLTAAKDAYGIADKLTDGETFAIAKEEPAVVKSAAYNQETNVLTVTFDQPVAIVEASQADGQTLLSLNVEGGAVQTVQANNIVGDRTLTQATWKFDLGVAAHNVAGDVEGLANVATKLKVYGEKDIFVNAAKVKNTDAQKDYEKGVAVAYTKDEKKPCITGVEFNNLTNELTLKFSEKVTLEAGANFIIDTDEDAILRATIAQAKFTNPAVAKDTFVATLHGGAGEADEATVTALNNLYATGKDLKLTVAKEVITDTNNLKNDVVDFAHGANVVFHDYVKPTVTGITTESSTKVKVVFDEKVDKTSAEKVANYVIKDATGSALAVTGAQLQADGKTVYLTTATQTAGKPYDVTVSNVKDLQGNIMDTKLQKDLLGNGEVKDAKLEVNALEAKAVENGKDTLKVTFSAQVDPVLAKNLANYAVLAKGTDAKYEDAKAVSLAGATAKIDPADANSVIITLADGVNILNTKEYKVIVSNVKDVYGNELDATKVSNIDVADGDTTLAAPKVTINQLDGKDNDTVTLVFNEQLNPETVVKGNFKVDNKAVTGVSTSWDAEKKEYTVTLQTGTDFTAAKEVKVDDKVVDLAGNKLTNGTIAAVDVTLKDSVKPTLSKVEAKAVSEAKDTIKVTFDKDVVEASAKVLANYTLTDESGKSIDLKDATIAYANKVVTISLPDGSGDSKNEVNLQHGKNYTLTVQNVVDLKGNVMNKATKTVTWVADSDATAPTYTVATNAGTSTITLTFNEKVDLSKVDLSTFTIKYDADKADVNNELTKLNPIYVDKANDSKTITITLDSNVKAAAAGKTAIVIASINDGKEVYDLAGNKAAHDAVNGNDMATAMPATPALANNVSFADAIGSGKDGKTVITLGEPSVARNTFVYKISDNDAAVATPKVGDDLSTWTAVTNGTEITAANGKHIGVAEVDAQHKAVQFTDATAVTVAHEVAKAAVKTADDDLGSSVAFGTATKIVINGTDVTLTNIKVLGGNYNAVNNIDTVVTELQKDINATALSGQYTVAKSGNKLTITSVATGAAAKVDLTGSDTSTGATLLGFTTLNEVKGTAEAN